MRFKIYVLTENLTFFYRLNKELNRFKIKFKIINFWNKVPVDSSLILTTCEEVGKIRTLNLHEINILSWSNTDKFDRYILKIIAAYRVGYKNNYSELTFSIDPGTKYFGLVVFLDDYYLDSHTFYDKDELIKTIINYLTFLQEGNQTLLIINIKFGGGVLLSTHDLIKKVFNAFKKRNNVKVFLIDETKSSKINIHHDDKKFPKHEASALILALREGIDINQKNYTEVFKQLKSKKKKSGAFKNNDLRISSEFLIKLREIANKILNGKQSLSESFEILKEYNENREL